MATVTDSKGSAMTTTHFKLIFADLTANSNKFWEGERRGFELHIRWGRIGEAGQSTVKHFPSDDKAQRELDKVAASKLRKGYTHQATVGGSQAAPVAGNLGAIARKQIAHGNCAETRKLIDFLVKRNIHAIEGATSLKWTGTGFTTPLGPVTEEGIAKAEAILGRIDAVIADRTADITSDVNAYLRIIPMHVKRNTRNPRAIFYGRSVVKEQQALLDALRSVLKDAEVNATQDAPEVFKTELTLVDAGTDEFAKVQRRFERSINQGHQSSGMKLKKVWRVKVAGADAAFENDGAKVGNIMELWHGTTDGNLLSLLKSGYKIASRTTGVRITGRMFGDGLYFSDQSTKSLNYATGFWGAGRSARAFMLLNEVAMGKGFVPSGPISGGCRPGYDSTFAKAGQSGVRNNEMIVYRASQVRPTYLCEFE